MKRMMRFVFGLCVAWLLAGDAIAANGSWTSMGNGTTGYWTNNANWSGGTYPGSGAGETALFTNNNTGSYTAILDKTLPNALSTITMGTNGSQGYPILIFTNAIAVTSTAVTVGYNSSNNTLSVMPSVNWNLGNSDITVGNGGTGNVLTVNGGTLISNRNFIVTAGNTATFSNGATLVFAGLTGAGNGGGIRVDSGGTLNLGGLGAASGITNLIGAGSGYPVTVSGGTMILMNATLLSQQGSGSADINIGRNQFWGSGVGNSMVQVLANGFWNVPSLRTFFIGQASSTNSLLINAGKVSIATSGNIGYGSGGSVFSNNVTVVNGGNFTINGLTVGNYNIGTSPTYWNSFNMGGVGNVSTGSVGALTIGSGAPSSYNTMTVTNAVLTSAATTVGASSSSNNTATVQAGGTWNSGALTVGGSSANNSVQILAGGVLDMAANAMTTAAGAGNVITNTGGVYQFSTATPTITPTAGAGSIALNNGKISFRAITTADVRCNQTNTLTNMLFSGQNAFRLNTATNATTGQAYTFMNNGTATNFVRLELLNSSMYRTNVTLGANGSLYCSGTNWVSGVLTAAVASATIEIDLTNTNALSCLVAQSNVFLNGCQLLLDLGASPLLNTPITIISNANKSVTSGSFAGGNLFAITPDGARYYSVTVSNTFGTNVVVTLQSLGVAPTIQNQPASSMTTTSAVFNGYLSSTGTAAATVYVLWDTNNDLATGAWPNTNTWAGNTWPNNTSFSTNIALAANQDYYYTFGAVNATTNVTASPPQYLMTGALSVQATKPNGRANLTDPVTFTVTRPANCTNGNLVVYYTLTGTGSNGVDYTISPASGYVVILAGQTSATITVMPIYGDPQQTVIVTLSAGPYTIGTGASDTGTLAALTLPQWWDTSSGIGLVAGSGDWSTSANNWALNSYGTTTLPPPSFPPLSPWYNNSLANFAAAGTSTVNVQNVTAAGMNITAGVNVFQPGSGPLTLGSLGITSTVSATFNNDIALSANQTWNNSTGTTLTVTGLVSGAAALTKAGAGTLVLSNANSSFSGGLTVNNGSVNAYAQSSSTNLGSGPLTIGTVVPTDGSIFTNATVTLNNGGASNYTNTIGNLTNSGAATLILNSAAGTTNTLIAGSLARTTPGSLVLQPANSLAVRENVKLTGNANLTNGIVQPWLVNSLNSGDYVTTNSVGALTNATYAGKFNAGLNNLVVTNAVATNLTSSTQTNYAAKLTANLNLNGNTLTLGDGNLGGLILGNGVAITNGGSAASLAFGTAEALLYVGTGNSATIATPMTGSGALTKFGGGTLVISNSTPWQGGPVNLNGGALTLWATQNLTATNWLSGPGAFTKDGPNTLTLRGTNAIGGTLTENGGGTMNVGTSGGNDLLISSGAMVGNGSANNTLNLASNATWNLFGQSVTVGSGTATNNVLAINSGVITNGSVIVGGSSGSVGNGLVVTNGNQFLGNINVTLGNAAGANNNYYNVGGGASPVTVSNGAINVGTGGGNWDTMTVNSAQLWSSGLTISGGNSNTVTVLPNSTWNLLGGTIGLGNVSNGLVISGGTFTNVGAVNVGSTAAGNNYNYLTVSNGGSLYASSLTLEPYNGAGGGSFNVANLGGAGAPSTVYVSGSISSGNAGSGFGNNSTLTISNAYVTSTNTVYVAGKGAYNDAIYVLQGGTLNIGAGITIASGGAGGQHDNTLVINGGVVTGAASTVSIGYDIYGPYRNSVIITNGGQLYNQAITLGVQALNYSNNLTITGVGSLCNLMGKNLTVGPANSTGNVASVLSGAILEVGGLVVTAGGVNNIITNNGSVYQFNTAAPTMTTTTNNCFINGGTISFRGITNADVLCNQSGKPFDSTNKMAWAGITNVFRLNNATNLPTGQAYTFTTAYGSTNFARLELLNGSRWSTNVVLGANGSLYCSGVNYISGVLTAADVSATIEFDLSKTSYLVAQSNIFLNGCHVQLDQTNPPLLDTPVTVISNTSGIAVSGTFTRPPMVTIGGTNYVTSITTTGGTSGKDVVVTTRLWKPGTAILFW